MKFITKNLLAVLLLIVSGQLLFAQHPEEKLGWELGSQAYTFNRFTFLEALDKIDSCGLKYVEGFPGQTIGGDIEGKMDYKMEPAKREQILKKLKDKGIKMVAFGVVNANSAEEWEQLFQFAKAMGMQNITSEPKETDIPLLSKLCDKYKINIAIHDHPKPSHYWHPDTVLKVMKGQSPRIGACADIGHWVRSGLDPVECLKKLEGHIKGLHLKDLNVKARDAHDVPWGTGVSNIEAVLKELKRQKFKGVISAEYEYNWLNNTPEVALSAKNVREMIKKW
ncbi:MAG: sugar phosphate isomerase/epimerase [Chitinophagaceae bacterium]